MDSTFTPVEAQLLTRLQRDLPHCRHPFAGIARELSLLEDEVLVMTRELMARGVIREISGLFDSRALGYHSLLVAAEVPPDRLDAAAEVVNSHPGVSHNYARAHALNLWFTLAVPPDSALGVEGTLRVLQGLTGAGRLLPLPAIRTFKLSVQFDLAGEGSAAPAEAKRATRLPSPEEIAQIRLLQQPLPLEHDPYAAWAEELGMMPGAFVAGMEELYAHGFLRRLAAVLRHRAVGYTANAMGVWNVPDDRVEAVGTCFAQHPMVSHCYERPRQDGWPYNLFTMVHGHSPQECEAALDELAVKCNAGGWQALYSVKEFKKARLKFYAESLPEWERTNGV